MSNALTWIKVAVLAIAVSVVRMWNMLQRYIAVCTGRWLHLNPSLFVCCCDELSGSQASEFLDVALYLRGSKLELVGVGYGEAF